MDDATRPHRTTALAEFAAAVIFLTRLPVPWRGSWPADLNQRALAWFPIVGALIGAAGGLLYWGLSEAALPPLLAAALTTAGLALLTGALHEDGLADIADGFGGGRDRNAKLSIMKDSRVGTYGALALVLAALLKVGALAQLAEPRTVALALIAAHAFSRGLLPALKQALPDARDTGLSVSQGRPNMARALVAAVIGLSLAATCLGKLPLGSGLVGLGILSLAATAVVGTGLLARRQIGGITGDVLGAAQQLAEITLLLAAVAALGRVG